MRVGPHDGINALIKRKRYKNLCLGLVGMHKKASLCNSERTISASTLILDLPAFRSVKNNVVCLSHPVCSIFVIVP